jgi:hypothetical protein
VDIILNRGVDPNAVSAKNAVVGSVAGDTLEFEKEKIIAYFFIF